MSRTQRARVPLRICQQRRYANDVQYAPGIRFSNPHYPSQSHSARCLTSLERLIAVLRWCDERREGESRQSASPTSSLNARAKKSRVGAGREPSVTALYGNHTGHANSRLRLLSHALLPFFHLRRSSLPVRRPKQRRLRSEEC